MKAQIATADVSAANVEWDASEVFLQRVEFRVNGIRFALETEPREILLDTLRDVLGCTGTKKGCDHGQCGACTVLLDGERVNACLILTAAVDGRQVETIEGLEREGALHPVQQAFLEHDAFQCGYCTSGQIMSAVALMKEPASGDDDSAIQEAMSGNLCRCGAYRNILAAVKAARRQSESQTRA